MKVRLGRGFTFAELKAAGINRHEARGVGITVDHRRRNRSEQSLSANVERLKTYKARLVVFPRHPSSKRIKRGDATKEVRQSAAVTAATQSVSVSVLPYATSSAVAEQKPRKITTAERSTEVRKVLRKALTDEKRAGARVKRAKEKADEAAGKSKKADATADAGGGGDE